MRIEAFRFPEAEEHVLLSINASKPIGEVLRDTARIASREEALRAIFAGLSCDLLRSERWSTFR